MRMFNSITRRVAGAAGLGLALSLSILLAPSAAHAGTSFQIYGVPDLDQVRDLLPITASGVPGGSACMMATRVDLANYLGSHGFPEIMDTTHTTETPYIQDTYRLLDMHTYNLAGNGGLVSYVQDLTTGVSNLKLNRFSLSPGLGTAADFSFNMLMFQQIIKITGMPLAMRIFRDAGWSTGTLTKKSQHWFPMTGLLFDVNQNQQVVHTDPATDEGSLASFPDKIYANSTWATAVTSIQFPMLAGATRAVFGSVPVDTSKTVSIIQNVEAYVPSMAVTLGEAVGTSATGIVSGRARFDLSATPHAMGTTDSAMLGPSTVVDTNYMPQLSGITDVAWVPGTLQAVFGGNTGAVWVSDYANHTLVQIATLSGAVTGVAGGTLNHDIYATAGTSLYIIHHNPPSLGGAYTLSSVNVGSVPKAVFADPNLGHIGVVVGSTILYYDTSLQPMGKAALPAIPGTGPLLVRSRPEIGALYFKHLGSPQVVVATLTADDTGFTSTSTITLGALSSAQGFDVDAEGEVYASNGRAIVVFNADGSPDTSNRLNNLAASTFVALTHDYDDHLDDALDLEYDSFSADENP
jgi:hypothetical protein